MAQRIPETTRRESVAGFTLAACRTLINRRQLQDIPSKLMTPRIDESYRLLIRERKGGKGAVSGVLVCYALA